MRFQLLAVVCLCALAGCGGGGDGGSTPPPSAPPPPPVIPPPPPAIGANGGTVTETSGAAVIFPAGAVATNTTFRIAMDSTGAPPVPADMGAVGNMYVITPHGGEFAQPVEVRIPTPTITLQPNQLLKLAKAEPGGEWMILEDSAVVDGKLTVQVGDFSFFTAVVVTYVLPIAQAAPLRVTTSLSCTGLSADGAGSCSRMVGDVTATFTVVGDNGALPANCQNGSLFIGHANGSNSTWVSYGSRLTIPRTGGSQTVTVARNSSSMSHTFGVGTLCGYTRSSFGYGLERRINWPSIPDFPEIRVVSPPTQLDVVEGMSANLDVLLMGGAFRIVDSAEVPPSRLDRAVIDWQRSDDGGASWRTIATSFQDEANALPAGTGLAWRPWRVRHGFIATATDQGALIRVHACYTPPAPTAAAPCAIGTATRLNVLQQSALPRIVTAPRSVLIRTGETANFSATASGAPAPTLQWQTRPANSTGEWTNVTVGTGATTANYTTAPRTPSDNGEQYRVVATNALGSAESAPVTLSVSDLDVAPSITTQPASLSVATGSDAVFAVAAYGTEALSYQWRYNGADIAGANSPVLRLIGVTSANAGAYAVSVTNSAGNAVSSSAMLTVTAGTPVAVAPTIVTQPSPVTVNAGNTATLAVGVAGTGPFTFQWQRDGVNVDGATSAVLTFNAVALPNAGSYSVRVTNSAGEAVSNDVTLDVTTAGAAVAPTITSQPATLIVPLNGSGTIAVGATGSGPLTYQWYLDGQALPGSTLPVLNFTHLGEVDFGRYTVTVTNSVSSVTSQPADLILLGAPVITQQPAAVTILEGNNATFWVQASGSGLRYQWSLNGTPIPGAIAATFNTPTLVAANSGAVYSVLVYNGAGLVFSQGAVLTVQTIVAPSIIQHPANSTIAPGLQAQMCVTIGGTPTFDVVLQRWNGAAWVSGAGVLVNGNTNVCYFTDVLQQADNGAQFRFLVQNPAGQAISNTATVTVQAVLPPAITSTTLVSESLNGGPANNSSSEPSMSADGSLIAFISQGTDLDPDAPTVTGNAYVRNMRTGVTRLINSNTDGDQSTHGVFNVKLSSNGRYAIFTSRAGDLVAGDTNDSMDVFRRDLLTGTTIRLSVLPNGDQLPSGVGGNGDYQLDISADGRVVLFRCAFDIGPGGTGADNGNYFLYYRDVQSGVTRLVAGSLTYGVAYSALSADGEWIAYAYGIPQPADQTVQLVDIEAHTETELFRFSQNNGEYLHQGMSISGSGRYVAFSIVSPELTGSPHSQVVVRDRDDPNALAIASMNLGVSGDGSSAWPKISGDGRYVIFSTVARSLTNNLATSNRPYVVVGDIVENIVTIASTRSEGDPVWAGTYVNGNHALSVDGTTIAFVPDTVNMGMGMFGDQVFATPRP